MANTSFTIDVGEKFIKIVDIEKKGNTLTALSLAYDQNNTNIYLSESFKDQEATGTLIQKLVKDAGIKKRDVNVVIPDSHSYAQILVMPDITEKELLSAIKYQADQFIPIPIDKVNLDIEILSGDKKNKKLTILLVAAPLVILDKVTSLIESCGLVPNSIQTELSASLSLLNMMKMDPKACTLFINIGLTSSTLYLICPNSAQGNEHIPFQIRNFPLGLDIFLKDIKSNFNINDKEANNLIETYGFTADATHDISKILQSPYNEFVVELQKFIQSIKSTNEIVINNICIFGEGYKMKGLNEKLTQSLTIPIQIFNPYSLFSSNNVLEFFKKDLPLFIPAIGGSL